MRLYARQGDLVIESLNKIDGELVEVNDVVFAGDNSGHRHRLIGPALIRREGFVTLVKLEMETELIHEKSDGHKTVKMAVGCYEVRPLRERGDGTDRAVAD